jgi:hypothetical protein
MNRNTGISVQKHCAPAATSLKLCYTEGNAQRPNWASLVVLMSAHTDRQGTTQWAEIMSVTVSKCNTRTYSYHITAHSTT